MLGLPEAVTACLFDLDGVLTQTAKVHDRAWKQTFDEYLRARAEKTGEEFKEFDAEADYNEYVDGKPRYDGVRSFLQSRGIELPEGTPNDPPDAETICGIGNRKNELVLKMIKEDGRRALRGVGALRQGRARRRPAARGRLLQRQLQGRARRRRHRGPVRGARRRPHRRRAAPQGQARARHVPGRRPRAGRVARPRGGVRGRGGRSPGGPRRGVRLSWSASTGVGHGHADALRQHGASVVVKDLAELLDES